MNNILVFDTATTACSVALKSNEHVFSRHIEKANIHSKALLQMVDDLLNESGLRLSDINLLCIGSGPGSFTGLRIGMGVAQGLAYSNSIPVVMLSTLEMIALNSVDNNIQAHTSILVAHDARMSEMYVAEYEYLPDHRLMAVTEPFLLKPSQFDMSEFSTQGQPLIFSGNAWEIYFDQFGEVEQGQLKDLAPQELSFFPDAVKVVKYISNYRDNIEVTNWAGLSPRYVRNDVAKKSLKNKF
jgi:tRNA threonylcarbamoyladenosine biosynthesis protein TsaB